MRALLVLLVVLCNAPALAQSPTAEQKTQVAPAGALRAAIVKIPFLAKQDAGGAFKGVAPELAEAMARVLGVPYQPVAFDSPNAGIKALRDGAADVTFLAPTPERAGLIDFAPAFMQMEVTLIVPGASPIQTLSASAFASACAIACPTDVFPSVTRILRPRGSHVNSRNFGSSDKSGLPFSGIAMSAACPARSSAASTRTRHDAAPTLACR